MSAGAKLFIAAALLLAVALANYLYSSGVGLGAAREWKMTDTEKGVVYDFDANADFYSFDAMYFYFCTKDGMRYISSDGNVEWQTTFNLIKPVMTAKGNMVAVGESRGKNIYVFDSKGLAYSVSLDYPALYFSVNEAGYLAVILQLDQGYAVNVYNRSKNVEPYFYTQIYDTLMQPVSAGVSADGRFAAISVLDLNVHMTSRVYFYYMNQRDSWTTEAGDGLFAFQEFKNQIAYRVEFMDGNKTMVATDENIACYQPGDANKLELLWNIPLHNEINHLTFYGGSRFAFVTEDKRLNDDEAADIGVAHIYNMSGELTGTFPIGRKATYMSMGNDAVIVGADRSFYALDQTGKQIWEYISLQDTRGFLFLGDTNTVLMAGGARATVMRHERVKATETASEGFIQEKD
jgi:hypothetical protein